MSHLHSARRCIASAINDPDAAAGLLSRAARCISKALRSVTPETPADVRDAVAAEAEELFVYIRCFEEAS